MTRRSAGDGRRAGLCRTGGVPSPCRHGPASFRLGAPGGHLLLGFQATDDAGRLAEPFDHKVAPACKLSPDGVAGLLRTAGFEPVAHLVREPGEQERFLQAAVLARGQGPR